MIDALINPVKAAIWVSYVQHVIMLLALSVPLWARTRSNLRLIALVVNGLAGVACAWMTRGWLGELSLTNTVWSSLCVVCGFLPSRQQKMAMPTRVATSIAVIATPMFAGALLLAPWDLYALGYPAHLGIGALTLALGAWFAGFRFWAAVIVTGVILWSLGIRHSPNLWDMLVDAPTWVAALVVCSRRAWRKYRISSKLADHQHQ